MFFLHDKTKKNNKIGSLDTDTFFLMVLILMV